MKKNYFLVALAISVLCVSCGQTTDQNQITNQPANLTDQQIPTILNDTVSSETNNMMDPFNDTAPLDYIVLDLPTDTSNSTPSGMYMSEDRQLNAIVELPNETNTQNLGLVLGPDDIRTIQLTDTLSFWKLSIYNEGDTPISVTIEDTDIGEGKFGIVQNISPNQITTIYNTIPWPAGQYQIQFMTGGNKVSATMLTTETLDGLLIEQ